MHIICTSGPRRQAAVARQSSSRAAEATLVTQRATVAITTIARRWSSVQMARWMLGWVSRVKAAATTTVRVQRAVLPVAAKVFVEQHHGGVDVEERRVGGGAASATRLRQGSG
jgi:hypothetical protein